MALNIAFSDDDWDRIERDWSAWWAHELDRPLVMVEGRVTLIEEYPPVFSDRPAEEIIARYTPNLEAMRWYGDSFPRCILNFGPGIIAGFLGAHVRPTQYSTWFEPAVAMELGDMSLLYAPDNLWWGRVREITKQAVMQWEGKVAITTADLGGNLDILASIRDTNQLLIDLVDQPNEIDRLAREITKLWLCYYHDLDSIIRPICRGVTPWAPIWSKGTNYMLQCDIAGMISPRLFERFVLPDLTTCCEFLEFPFYHLDGPGQIIHLDSLLAISNLRGIQWVPTDRRPGTDEWMPLLKRIITAGKLCQIYVSPEEALNVIRHLGGKSFALYINQRMSAEEAGAFLNKMQKEDISTQRSTIF